MVRLRNCVLTLAHAQFVYLHVGTKVSMQRGKRKPNIFLIGKLRKTEKWFVRLVALKRYILLRIQNFLSLATTQGIYTCCFLCQKINVSKIIWNWFFTLSLNFLKIIYTIYQCEENKGHGSDMGNCTQYIIYLNALIDALASIKKLWHHWGSHSPLKIRSPLNTKAPHLPLIYLVGLLAVSDPHISMCRIP